MAASHPAAHRIRSISVIGGFLDGVRLELADGLNCFIGGRGTGKTTALEFVRFALDAMPDRNDDRSEARRIESLVEHNLAGGRVQVEIETKNGLVYIVSRTWGEEPVVLTADGKPTQLTLKAGSVFRADIYSQNEVERIADRTVSQLILIDNFQEDEITQIGAQLRELEQSLSTNANQITSLNERQAELREELATLPDVEEKLKAFTGVGGDDALAIDQAHDAKALRERESRTIEGIDEELSTYEDRIHNQRGQLTEETVGQLTEEMLNGPNGIVMSELRKLLKGCADDIDVLLKRILDRVGEARQQVQQASATIASIHDKQEIVFRTLIEQHESAMEQAAERAHLERLRSNLLAMRRTSEALAKQASDLRRQRDDLLSSLSELRDRRFAIREAVANNINGCLAPAIRISVEQFGELSAYESVLVESLRGARIHNNVVAERIADAVPPRELADIVRIRDLPRLVEQAAINTDQATKVIDALNDNQLLFELEAAELNDKPRIELKDGDTYKASLSISTGQKCTSILPILLLDSDRPLLVDQPEDNLDNGFIYDTVVTRLCEVKKHRQMIFVTHNPNIPVLGEANKVFVFDSNGIEGSVENEGTVDDCKDEIISLLEGGEDAFKRRKERYKY